MVAGAALCAAPLAGHAQTSAFPTKAVRIIVPYTPGGSSDAIARIVGERMAVILGQPVVIENRPGASTMIGAEYVARARNDGYTLLFGLPTTFSTNPYLYRNIRYSLKDFEPVGLMAMTDWVMAVSNSFPADNLTEFVRHGRARTKPIHFGMLGAGSTTNFVGKMVEAATGVTLDGIPYKGTAPALADLMGGQIDVYFDAVSSAMPLYQAGKLKIFGVMREARSTVLSDVPTFAEQGYPDVIAKSWYGIFAPAGTPQAVIATLNGALAAAVRSEEVLSRFGKDGTTTEAMTPASFAAMIAQDQEKWGKLIKPLNIQLD